MTYFPKLRWVSSRGEELSVPADDSLRARAEAMRRQQVESFSRADGCELVPPLQFVTELLADADEQYRLRGGGNQ